MDYILEYTNYYEIVNIESIFMDYRFVCYYDDADEELLARVLYLWRPLHPQGICNPQGAQLPG